LLETWFIYQPSGYVLFISLLLQALYVIPNLVRNLKLWQNKQTLKRVQGDDTKKSYLKFGFLISRQDEDTWLSSAPHLKSIKSGGEFFPLVAAVSGCLKHFFHIPEQPVYFMLRKLFLGRLGQHCINKQP